MRQHHDLTLARESWRPTGGERAVMPPRNRRGMTLVEVLGGLAILASLLVVILVARDRHVRQSRLATERVEAARVADDLLTTWWQEPDRFPRDAAGVVGGRLRWETVDATDAEARGLGLEIVRLRVWPAGDARGAPVAIDVAFAAGAQR